MGIQWYSAENKPEPLMNVLIRVKGNSSKNTDMLVAHFCPKFTEEYYGDDDWCDWDDDRQLPFVKEGWYGNTTYIGDDYSSYFVDAEVIEWSYIERSSN